MLLRKWKLALLANFSIAHIGNISACITKRKRLRKKGKGWTHFKGLGGEVRVEPISDKAKKRYLIYLFFYLSTV
jgi:hypothetical protein